jgi:hypothetical protein
MTLLASASYCGSIALFLFVSTILIIFISLEGHTSSVDVKSAFLLVSAMGREQVVNSDSERKQETVRAVLGEYFKTRESK